MAQRRHLEVKLCKPYLSKQSFGLKHNTWKIFSSYFALANVLNKERRLSKLLINTV